MIRLLRKNSRNRIFLKRRYTTIYYNRSSEFPSSHQRHFHYEAPGADNSSNFNSNGSNFDFVTRGLDLSLASKNDFEKDDDEKEAGSESESANALAPNLGPKPFDKRFYDSVTTIYNRTLLANDWYSKVLLKTESEQVEYFYKRLKNGQHRYRIFSLIPNNFKKIVNVNTVPQVVADQKESILYSVVKNVSFKVRVPEPEPGDEDEPEPEAPLPSENEPADSTSTSKSLSNQDQDPFSNQDIEDLRENNPETVAEKVFSASDRIKFVPTDYSKIKNLVPDQNEDSAIFEFKDVEQKEAFVILSDIADSAYNVLEFSKSRLIKARDFVKAETPQVYDWARKSLIMVSIPFEMLKLVLEGDLNKPTARLVVSEPWQDKRFSKENCNSSTFVENSSRSVRDGYSIGDTLEFDEDGDQENPEEAGDSDLYFSSNPVVSELTTNLNLAELEIIGAETGDQNEDSNKSDSEFSDFSKKLSVSDLANLSSENSRLILTNYQLIHQISVSTPTLKMLGYAESEYFYHKFTLFDRNTNAVILVSIGIDDVEEQNRISAYERKYRDDPDKPLADYYILDGYDQASVDRLKTSRIKNFVSSMHITKVDGTKTLVASDYTDAMTKDLSPFNWLSRKGLETGFTHTNDRVKSVDCLGRFEGTVNEVLLELVDGES